MQKPFWVCQREDLFIPFIHIKKDVFAHKFCFYRFFNKFFVKKVHSSLKPFFKGLSNIYNWLRKFTICSFSHISLQCEGVHTNQFALLSVRSTLLEILLPDNVSILSTIANLAALLDSILFLYDNAPISTSANCINATS